jgi:hypothetical protein
MLWKLNFIIIYVLNLITEIWVEDREYKYFVEAGSLDDQERHLTLEMPTLRMAHTDSERERAHLQNNIKPKSEQLKLGRTYPSMWP